MEELVEVTQVGMKKLGNGLHVNFHRSAYDLVNECEVAKIGITDAVKVEWNGHIDTEEEKGLRDNNRLHNTVHCGGALFWVPLFIYFMGTYAMPPQLVTHNP